MAQGEDAVRLWTVDEANEALPRVTEVVERARKAATELGGRVQALREVARTNGHPPAGAEGAGAFNAAVAELAAEGIVLRDVERGLVDFPAEAPSGRIYWLCWLVGESEVAWWHWPEDGFAGRTPLDDPPR